MTNKGLLLFTMTSTGFHDVPLQDKHGDERPGLLLEVAGPVSGGGRPREDPEDALHCRQDGVSHSWFISYRYISGQIKGFKSGIQKFSQIKWWAVL